MTGQNILKSSLAENAQGSKTTAVRYLAVFLFLGTVLYLLMVMSGLDIHGGINGRVIQLTAFLLLGVFSVFFLARFHAGTDATFSDSLWRLSVIEGLLFAVSITVVYFGTGIIHLLMAVASFGAFLLPVIVYEAYRAFGKMPGVAILTWQPFEEKPDQRVHYKKNSEIQFKLTKRVGVSGSSPTVIAGKVSQHDLLGKVFNELVSSDNMGLDADIDMQDEEGRWYSWAFFVSDPVLGKRWLDPLATLHMNKLKDLSVVIVKRIKTSGV